MAIIATGADASLIIAIQELALYLMEHPLATACNVGNSFYLVADEWERRGPKTPHEIRSFYREAKAYLWNLTFANYGIPHQRRWQGLAATHSEGKTVLDLGAGVGSTLLECRRAVRRVHADVGGILSDYAKWRYAHAQLEVGFVELGEDYLEHDPLSRDVFDFVVCTEVLEHVPAPDSLALYLIQHIKHGGKLLASVSFEDDHHNLFPCHLNRDRFTNRDFEERIFPALGLKRLEPDLYEFQGVTR